VQGESGAAVANTMCSSLGINYRRGFKHVTPWLQEKNLDNFTVA
jgi:hypothetical protein